MNSIFNLANQKIIPTKHNFLIYIFVLISSNLFFHIAYLSVFLSILFWKLKAIPVSLRVLLIGGFSILMLGLNIAQIVALFGVVLPAGTDANILNIVRFVEALHLIVFAGFFWGIFNIIFLKISPSSLIYVGMYNLLHAIFADCPLISLQNFLNPLAGNALFLNEFWQGFFGQFTTLARILISILSLIMFYLAYKQLQKNKLRFRYLDCYFPWNEYQLNRKTA